jgi:membrane-associated protein
MHLWWRYPARVGAGGLLAAGVPVLFGAITVIEAGIPLPVPGDVLMLLVGERAAANQLPIWLAALGLEAAVVAGTALLFFAVRGPLRGAIRRVGPRVGLTAERLNRATGVLEHRGQPAIAVGRATPSLRTLTAVAAATSRLPVLRALFWLVLGGSVFVQLHLVLGYFLGPVAERLLARAALPVLLVLAAMVGGAAVYWLLRHGRRRAVHAFSEATCPTCIALHAVPLRWRIDHHELAPAPSATQGATGAR